MSGDEITEHPAGWGIPSRSTYTRGCRCSKCKAANAAYNREHRQKVRESPGQSSTRWEGLNFDPKGSQDANQQCPVCNGDTTWTTARTLIVCDQGHYSFAAKTRRIIETLQEKAEAKKRDTLPVKSHTELFEERVNISTYRSQLIREAETMRNQFDPSDLASLSRNSFWDEPRAYRMMDVFTALIDELRLAKTMSELRYLDTAINNAYSSGLANSLRANFLNALIAIEREMRNRYPDYRNIAFERTGVEVNARGKDKPGLNYYTGNQVFRVKGQERQTWVIASPVVDEIQIESPKAVTAKSQPAISGPELEPLDVEYETDDDTDDIDDDVEYETDDDTDDIDDDIDNKPRSSFMSSIVRNAIAILSSWRPV